MIVEPCEESLSASKCQGTKFFNEEFHVLFEKNCTWKCWLAVCRLKKYWLDGQSFVSTAMVSARRSWDTLKTLQFNILLLLKPLSWTHFGMWLCYYISIPHFVFFKNYFMSTFVFSCYVYYVHYIHLYVYIIMYIYYWVDVRLSHLNKDRLVLSHQKCATLTFDNRLSGIFKTSKIFPLGKV